MILKVLVTVAALGMLWMLLFRATGGARRKTTDRRPKRRSVRTHELVKCPGCGIYLPAGQDCDCDQRV